MSWYSLSTSTSSVGFTGTPLRARQRPPAFWAFLSVERMRAGWSGSMARRALPSSMSRAQVQSRCRTRLDSTRQTTGCQSSYHPMRLQTTGCQSSYHSKHLQTTGCRSDYHSKHLQTTHCRSRVAHSAARETIGLPPMQVPTRRS